MREFTVQRSFKYAAPIRFVFEALIEDIDKWWCHRDAPDAEVGLQSFQGGHFFQTVNGNRLSGGLVKKIEGPHLIEIQGGPKVKWATSRLVRFDLEPDGYGTKLKVTHVIASDLTDFDVSRIRHAWGELLGACLREWVDERLERDQQFTPRFHMNPGA